MVVGNFCPHTLQMLNYRIPFEKHCFLKEKKKMDYISQLVRPSEVVALLKWKVTKDPNAIPESAKSQNLIWCYKMLNLTSRSFSFVIKELSDELRDAVIPKK